MKNSKGVGALTIRDRVEADDVLDNWVKPSKRTEEERRIYGPRSVTKPMGLLRELYQKLEKNPDIKEEVRTDLVTRETTHPDTSRFTQRLNVLRDQMSRNKKLRMKGKLAKTPFLLYQLFKGRLIVDAIFGDNLVTTTINKRNREQGIVDKEEPLVLGNNDSNSVDPLDIAIDRQYVKHKKLFEKYNWNFQQKRDQYGAEKSKFLSEVLKFIKDKKPSPKKPSPKKPSTGAANNTARSKSLSNSPPKTKRKRCPNGTRFNKKTQKCEPKK